MEQGQGVNESERYLSLLCKRTFLSLWSFPNLFRQPGSELCDLLVVCGDDIIIFSDKACQFPSTDDVGLNWKRWYNRAIWKSAKQLWGAEKWLKRSPERVFTDSACKSGLQLPIEVTPDSRFHLVLVAHGSSAPCKEVYRGSGSLILDNRLKGAAAHEQPFIIGDVDPDKTFIHVLDDHTLDILLLNRDTIKDFTDYLVKRKALLRSGKGVYAAGEEEMLAFYMRSVNEKGEHDFVMPNTDFEGYAFSDGGWQHFNQDPQRLRQLEADRISYFWDELIERFNFHTIHGSQYYVSEGGASDGEKAIRFLARENRFSRRILAQNFLHCIFTTPRAQKRIRVMPVFEEGLYYVLLLFPYIADYYENDYDLYREFRRYYLTVTAYVVRLMVPSARHVVGISMESGVDSSASSEDLIYFDCSGWNDELEKQTREDQHQLKILLSPRSFEFNEKEFPDH